MYGEFSPMRCRARPLKSLWNTSVAVRDARKVDAASTRTSSHVAASGRAIRSARLKGATMRTIALTNRGRLTTVLAVMGLVAGGLAGSLIPNASASAQSYNFQLNGDVAGGSPPTSFDWTNFFQPCSSGVPTCASGTVAGDITPTALTAAETTAGYVASAGTPDYVLADQTTFTGGTKDTLPI